MPIVSSVVEDGAKNNDLASQEPLVETSKLNKSDTNGHHQSVNSKCASISTSLDRITPTLSSNPIREDLVEEDDESDSNCGLWGFQMTWFQWCRTPGWLLFWLCWAGFLQGFIVNGMVNVVITTIEKRYQMRSTESGLIAGGYDVASFIFLVPVSYYGGTRSKPVFVGIGVLVLALGALVFSSPYYFAGRYEFSVEEEQLCPRNSTVCISGGGINTSITNYKYLFFLGQFLHGAGAAPFYTLGCAYIEESVPTRSSSLYLGIFYTMALLGPGAGYVIGGQFLRVYVDWLHVAPADIGLNSLSNIWVGCWWIGFLFGAFVAILVAFPIMAFPNTLPGTEKIKAEKVPEFHKSAQNSEATKKEDFGRTIGDLPKSIKILITNPTFMFLNLSGAMEGLLVSGLGTFLPKVLEQQFGLTSTKAAVLMGLTTLPGGGGGTFLGGYLVKRYDLKCAAIIKMCVAFSIVALLLGSSFLISCPTRKFAGITHSVGSDVSPSSYAIDSSCNQNCGCSKFQYDPVCGRDNVIYFSACHAGCKENTVYGDTVVYSNCTCLSSVEQSTNFSWLSNISLSTSKKNNIRVDAVRQTCANECGKLPLFLVFIFFSMVFTFLVSMPSLSATLRCVAESQKSFALGIQWLGVRALGTIPAPFIFGFFIDRSCLLWQTACDRNQATGACLLYDNNDLSIYMVYITVTVKMISLISFLLAWYFYTPPDTDAGELALKSMSEAS